MSCMRTSWGGKEATAPGASVPIPLPSLHTPRQEEEEEEGRRGWGRLPGLWQLLPVALPPITFPERVWRVGFLFWGAGGGLIATVTLGRVMFVARPP